MDTLVVASYFAPASTKKCGETAKRLCSWVESIYDKHSKRTTLLWMTDANGDFGLDRKEGGIRPGEENSNSREMRKTALESFLAVVATTWHDIGSTFFADHGRSSRIDHIVVPQAALGLVRSCRTLPIAGRRLQPFRTRERREHIPVAVEI